MGHLNCRHQAQNAIKTWDKKAIEKVLRNCSSYSNRSALFLQACAVYHTEFFDHLLVLYSHDISISNENIKYIGTALKSNISEFMRTFIEYGVDVNAANDEGMTPLIYAVETNMTPVRAKVADNQDLAKSVESFEKNVTEFIKVLLENGANVNASDKNGTSVLMTALRFQPPNTFEQLQILIDNGADVNAVDKYGWTVMIKVIQDGKPKGSEFLQFLIDNGANVDAIDNDGKTVLAHTFQYGNLTSTIVDYMYTLIKNGANVNATDNDGRTVLMNAFMYSDRFTIEVLQILIENGADLNASDKDGRTALMHALLLEYLTTEKLHLLIHNGANVNATDIGGKTVLFYALDMRNIWAQNTTKYATYLKFLIESGVDINPTNYTLVSSSQYCNEIIRFCLDVTFKADDSSFQDLTKICDEYQINNEQKFQLERLIESKRLSLKRQARMCIFNMFKKEDNYGKIYMKTLDSLIRNEHLPAALKDFMMFKNEVCEMMLLFKDAGVT